MTVIGDTDKRGTYVRSKPDGTIFRTTEYRFQDFIRTSAETAFLTKGLKITLTDLREVKSLRQWNTATTAGLKSS